MGFNQGTVAGASSFHSQQLPCTPSAEHIHPFIFTCRCSQTSTTSAFTHTTTNVHTSSLSPRPPPPHTHRGGGQRRMEGVMEERMKKKRGSAGLPGSQLLLGCCLLLAMSCNCQFILSQAFHHHIQPGWRKPPESLRNLLATSHQQRLLRCTGARDVLRVLLQTSVSL